MKLGIGPFSALKKKKRELVQPKQPKNMCVCVFFFVGANPNVPRLETALIEAVGTKTQAPLAGLVFDSDGCKTPVAQTHGGFGSDGFS